MGKKVVLFVIALTIVALIAGWFLLQYVVNTYDIDRSATQRGQPAITQEADAHIAIF